ncbi:hypothetical protein M3194_24960 [Paenibacillus glycanilyticus]|uniref:hypothetical protein n=1 Tax=Paenibacillus glycanilyticus TaxID=126569 RepID=UPI00203C413E|nr:hypothetical protein [Paenibacillus glycanilyticus]MCM3630585.1 hypothetical protein [Paenibacillus glycanilyticus]
MIIIGTFPHSIELEYALTKLESIGISRERLLVVCMEHVPREFQTDHQKRESSHSKGVEIGMACATALSVIGTSLGFIWTWGPIICGIIAAFIGFCLGFGIHAAFSKKTRQLPKPKADVSVIVQCHAGQAGEVQRVMWANSAFTVGLARVSDE